MVYLSSVHPVDASNLSRNVVHVTVYSYAALQATLHNLTPNCRAIIFVGFVLATRALRVGGELKLRELDAGKLVVFRFVWLLVEFVGVVGGLLWL